ncbi:MAG: methyltransferase domain-containing protein [Candidatus Bathyarchaeum sp.]|nr:MAG: methyltransferase domain-containing protein [Candidatus Bathyarchaeum sp.]
MQEWSQKRKTLQHYDQQAVVYDVQYLEEQNAKIEDALDSMEVGSNELVLDLGCGTGFLFPHIRKTKLLVGIDISSKALQVAKKRSNTLLVRADADNTPFPSHIFDRVFAITLLQNMPNPKKTISEMKRLSKPDAVFVVTGLKKKFTAESFVDLLRRTRLKVSTLKSDEHLKGHVAVCTNLQEEM